MFRSTVRLVPAVFEAIEERISQGQTCTEQVVLTDENFHSALRRFPRKSQRKIGFLAGETEED